MIVVVTHNPQTGQSQVQAEGGPPEIVIAVLKEAARLVEEQNKQPKLITAAEVPTDIRRLLPGNKP